MATKKPSASEKTPAQNEAAKKTSAAKRTSAAKKPAATKKAPAKKSAATQKAAASKKSATSNKPPAKKAPASKSGTSAKEASKSATRKKKSPFKVNDKVVYPHHGAAVIVKKEKQPVDGKRVDYFVLEVATDQLIVRVPVDRAEELGVRPVISQNQARKVFAVFRDEPQEAGSNWSRWYKVLTEKINSGDIYQVAEVVRDHLDHLSKAHLILNSELRFALNLDEEDTERRINRALPKVDVAEEG